MDDEVAIAFWQAEVHQFEFRAGEQGVLAQGMISAAAALSAAAVGAFAAVVSTASVDGGEISTLVRVALLAVPATIFLLWATGLRLLGEAAVLRECVRHAEIQLEALCANHPHLARYSRWTRVGLPFDIRPWFITLWALTALIVSVIGIFGTTLFVGAALGVWWWIPSAAAAGCAVLMALIAVENGRSAVRLRATLAGGSDGG